MHGETRAPIIHVIGKMDLAISFFIKSSSYLHVMRTTINSQLVSIFNKIGLFALESHVLGLEPQNFSP